MAALLIIPMGQTYAAWFEAQGQALVAGVERSEARRLATEEALKQALMFAGASVHSVQTLVNGLLQPQEFSIQANGEVNQLELVDEIWHEDYVTVRIRADIFAQAEQCAAAGFQKTLVTTYFPIQYPQQALDGQLQKLTHVLPRHLQQHFARHSSTVGIQAIAPYSTNWYQQTVIEQAPALARQHNTQYVLGATIIDLGVERTPASALAFWSDGSASRQFSVAISLLDGMHGGALLDKVYQITAPWEFDRVAQLDVAGDRFWRSAYGTAIDNQLAAIVADVDATLACQPATGRVLQVAGNQLQVSLGRAQGLQVGDELFLYQTSQVNDPFGQSYVQYNLYPVKVKVTAAYANSATVTAANDGLLINIQPNDYVAKR